MAVLDGAQNGIQFGPEGLTLLTNGKERLARSKLGSYYAKLPDGTRSLFANSALGKGRAELENLRVSLKAAHLIAFVITASILLAVRNAC